MSVKSQVTNGDVKKIRILVIYDYFDPATLAGGPIVSCVNIIKYLNSDYEFFVYSSHRDLDGSILKVNEDQWTDYQGIASVIYGKKLWSFKGYINVLKKIKPDIVYINGIYSLFAVVVPLLISGWLRRSRNIVLAPRGMLQKSSLNEKKYKKKLYLTFFLKLAGQCNLRWHVTGKEEEKDLKSFLRAAKSQDILNVGNIPVTDMNFVEKPRNEQTLILLTVALISPMKNILPVLKALHRIKTNVIYNIYGNIKDIDYWERCLNEIKSLPENIKVQYFGVADRASIPKIMEDHDYYIQPSKSENFGHSIYEALTTGLPVITSHKTPWNVQEKVAGWNVDGNSVEDISKAISFAADQNTMEYKKMARNAHQMAEDYLTDSALRQGYHELFAIT